MNSLNYSTIAEVTAAVKARKVSPVELVDATLARIGKMEPKLTAFMHLDAAGARKQARASEEAAAALEARGVRTIVMRLSQIHDTVKQGLVTYAIQIARQKGVSAYIGDGLNRFAAAPRLDTARLYQMALEKGDSGARYHAVAEEGVPMREIAEAIGQGLHVPVVSIAPEKAAEHFGWFARFAGLDISASSAQTRKKLGWNPKGPGLIADLENMRYE